MDLDNSKLTLWMTLIPHTHMLSSFLARSPCPLLSPMAGRGDEPAHVPLNLGRQGPPAGHHQAPPPVDGQADLQPHHSRTHQRDPDPQYPPRRGGQRALQTHLSWGHQGPLCSRFRRHMLGYHAIPSFLIIQIKLIFIKHISSSFVAGSFQNLI